jgi:hypothetical protein
MMTTTLSSPEEPNTLTREPDTLTRETDTLAQETDALAQKLESVLQPHAHIQDIPKLGRDSSSPEYDNAKEVWDKFDVDETKGMPSRAILTFCSNMY